MNPSFPLQDSNNCVAASYAGAIEYCLSKFPPEYHRRVTIKEIQDITGAPASVPLAGKQIEAAYPWIRIDDDGPLKTDIFPKVVATWRDAPAIPSHAICLLTEVHEYDPGKGGVQRVYGHERMAQFQTISVVSPPVVNKWRKYWWYRVIESWLGWNV